MLHSDLYTCSANGEVQVIYLLPSPYTYIEHSTQRWSASFNRTATWPAHSGIVLSSIITRLEGTSSDHEGHAKERFVLVTGASDDQIKVF